MNIEIRKFNETDDYILHVPTVKITLDDGSVDLYLSSDFLSEPGLSLLFPSLEIGLCERLFISFMLEPKTVQLLTWAACIAEYSYQHMDPCPIWSKKNDKIWENLIKVGIVVLKEKSDE